MKTKIMATLMLTLFTSSALFAAEAKMTKEQRLKMAEAHSKMADCLKSDKPLKECHKEMMKSCKENMGKSGCGMMGHKHMGKMMKGYHHMMDNDDAEEGGDKK